MKNLELECLGLIQLSSSEFINIDGGDADGLMRGRQYNDGFSVLYNGAATVVGFFVGLVNGK